MKGIVSVVVTEKDSAIIERQRLGLGTERGRNRM